MNAVELQSYLGDLQRKQRQDPEKNMIERSVVVETFRDWLEVGVIITCEVCGTPMEVHDSTKRYCSAQCRQLASLRRRVAVKTDAQERS